MDFPEELLPAFVLRSFLTRCAVLSVAVNVVSGLCVFFLPLAPMGYRRAAAIGMVTWLAGVLLLAWAVWQVVIWAFVAAFIPLGVGMGIFNLFLHVELTQLYPEEVGKAHAWGGFFIGFGAIVHAIIFGVLSDFFDVQRTLLGVCVLHVAVMGAAWHVGWSQLSFYTTSRQTTAAATSEAEQGDRNSEASVAAQQVAQAEAAVAAETAEKEKPTPALRLLMTWRMLGVLLLFFGFMFCGMAMKMLLSTVFEQVRKRPPFPISS